MVVHATGTRAATAATGGVGMSAPSVSSSTARACRHVQRCTRGAYPFSSTVRAIFICYAAPCACRAHQFSWAVAILHSNEACCVVSCCKNTLLPLPSSTQMHACDSRSVLCTCIHVGGANRCANIWCVLKLGRTCA
eukprot:4398588-Pleurochrysis_carterae.AAC.2